MRHLCVRENSIERPGYRPFKSTIGDRLTQAARESVEAAWTKDALHRIRVARV